MKMDKSTMEWSNESVLEFIELVQAEPCIWDPKHQHHSNRKFVNDAWTRIKNNFSWKCCIEELKKKRNSLLTQYRVCLRKIKESIKTGFDADDIYKPTWFAFNALHSYMGVVYDLSPTTETVEIIESKPLSSEAYSMDTNPGTPNSSESHSERSVSRESVSRLESDPFPVSKRQRGVQDVLITTKHIDESSNETKFNRDNNKKPNECDLYGQLLSEKLKSLEEDDRLVLMNEIDNLVFKYIMDVRKRSNSNRSAHFSTMNQTQLAANRQSADLP